ncbi:tRNA (guanine-N(7)-)-methyltransferase [bacterium HR39]|nr:tRNA (guanine-N(7)-)-methyltransferase [bacterium HR39]
MADSPGSAPTSSTSSGASPEPTPRAQRRIYGRRVGHRLRPRRRRLLEELLPKLRIDLDDPRWQRVDPRELFPGAEAVELEIGFGGGEHLVWQAERHPERGFVGVEPYLGGVARLLAAVEEKGLSNVRIVVDDARLLLPRLPDASLARIHVLFPDPWPKKRHHKRRIVNRETVRAFARLLVPGGELRLATDDPGYARWMLEAALAEPRLEWLAERAADWRERPPDWPGTRYEAKARREGRRPVFLRFRRRPDRIAPT